MSFAHVPSSFLTNLQRCFACFPDTAIVTPPSCPPSRQTLLHPSPQAASSKEHQMGWHCLVSWTNGCLFKHWSCLHCCGSLHVKHSPLKPYANPIKVSAVQRGEAITARSQVCLLSSRKENLIEQLKAKSDFGPASLGRHEGPVQQSVGKLGRASAHC